MLLDAGWLDRQVGPAGKAVTDHRTPDCCPASSRKGLGNCIRFSTFVVICSVTAISDSEKEQENEKDECGAATVAESWS